MLKRAFFIFIALFMGYQSLSATTAATSPQYAFQLVKSTIGDAVSIIENTKISDADKRAKLSIFYNADRITNGGFNQLKCILRRSGGGSGR